MKVRDSRGDWYKVRDGFYGRDFLLFASIDDSYISYLPDALWHRYEIAETGETMTDVDIEEENALKYVDPRDSVHGWMTLFDGTQGRSFHDILMSALYGNHMVVLQGGVKRDDEYAYRVLSASPLAKDKYRTAQMLGKGRGTNKDLVKAYDYCVAAASKGYRLAKESIDCMNEILKRKEVKA